VKVEESEGNLATAASESIVSSHLSIQRTLHAAVRQFATVLNGQCPTRTESRSLPAPEDWTWFAPQSSTARCFRGGGFDMVRCSVYVIGLHSRCV
jgi:hypothetical protein